MFIEKFTLYCSRAARHTTREKSSHCTDFTLFVLFLSSFSIFGEHINFIQINSHFIAHVLHKLDPI